MTSSGSSSCETCGAAPGAAHELGAHAVTASFTVALPPLAHLMGFPPGDGKTDGD